MGFEQVNIETETMEQKPFNFYSQISSEISEDYRLRKNHEILSSATNIHELPQTITDAFINLAPTVLSQLLTFTPEEGFAPEALQQIAASRIGMKTEILLLYIESFDETEPERRLVLSLVERQSLQEWQRYLKEVDDPLLRNRFENAIKKVNKSYENNPAKKSSSDLQLQFDYC